MKLAKYKACICEGSTESAISEKSESFFVVFSYLTL